MSGRVVVISESYVLRELAKGASNEAIAEVLLLSGDTVKSRLRSIYRKLGVASRGDAIALYVGAIGAPASAGEVTGAYRDDVRNRGRARGGRRRPASPRRRSGRRAARRRAAPPRSRASSAAVT